MSHRMTDLEFIFNIVCTVLIAIIFVIEDRMNKRYKGDK